MKEMFFGCSALSDIQFADVFSTYEVSNMTSLFQGCTSVDRA